jgi:hypothetical protein
VFTPAVDQARTLGYGLSQPIPLPDTGNELSDTTLLATGPGELPRLAFEIHDRPGVILDTKGRVISSFEPLPGYADHSVATPTGWYRLRALDDENGQVEILDPATLQPGEPSPQIPCAYPEAMSTARGRLLLVCSTGHLYAFASPEG